MEGKYQKDEEMQKRLWETFQDTLKDFDLYLLVTKSHWRILITKGDNSVLHF